MRFAGKRVLVTGAASGIGRATAQLFAREGAQVIIGDINEAGLAETAALIGEAATAVPYNAEDHASCRALVAIAAEGGLDVLCNVAGMLKWGPTETYAVEDFERILRINTTSVFVLCQAALKPMLKQRGGRIVAISSVVGQMGNAGQANYAASKAGLIGFCKSLAREVGSRSVTVNVVAPGFVETDMTKAVNEETQKQWAAQIPLGRLGSPDDIAAAVCFLASDEASYITGQVLAVNGGMYT